MAKAQAEPAAPSKGGAKGLLLLIVVGILAAAAGFAAPRLLPSSMTGPGKVTSDHEDKPATGLKLGFIPFEQVVVNVNEQRLARFLRVKLIVVVDASEEKQITELILKNKAIL